MLKIDFKAFIQHRYWFGFYFWHWCRIHRYYKSNCEKCNEGVWQDIRDGRLTMNPESPPKLWRIYKMPMNSVLWNEDSEDA